MCGVSLTSENYHADHVIPFSLNGATDVANGQALCANCNIKKGCSTMSIELRDWQEDGKDVVRVQRRRGQESVLVASAPASGKTFFACSVMEELRDIGGIEKFVVVSPSENVRDSWQEDVVKFGFQLKSGPHYPYDRDYHEYQGMTVTYAWMNANETLLRSYCDDKTMVVLDEVHHCGDERSWGESCFRAFENAAFRLLLSGTPWRTEGNAIPFVNYDSKGYSIPDYKYSVGDAVRDGVCQKPEIMLQEIGGEIDVQGEGFEFKSFEEARDHKKEGVFYRSATENEHVFLSLFNDANDKLDEIRKTENPDAGGMIIAKDIRTAHQYADWVLIYHGEDCAVIHSDMKNAHQKINEFKKGSSKWLISVDMIGEGTNIPRLQVELYLHTKKAPISLYQYWLRVARVRSRRSENLEHCYIYGLAHEDLIKTAKEIEEDVKIKIKEKQDSGEFERTGSSSGDRVMLDAVLENATIGDEIIASGGVIYSQEEIKEARQIKNEMGSSVAISLICEMLRAQKKKFGEAYLQPPKEDEVPIQVQKQRLRKRIHAIVGNLAYRQAHSEGKNKPDQEDYRRFRNMLNSRAGIADVETATVEDLKSMLELASSMGGSQ